MLGLFRVFIPAGTVAVLLCELLLIVSAFTLACYLVLPFDPTIFLFVDGGLQRILIVIATIVIGLHFNDLYSRIRVNSRIILAQQLCLVIGVCFLVQGFLAYLDADLRVPIRVMVVGNFITLIAIFGWRVFFSEFALQIVGGERILLVGASSLLVDIAQHIAKHPETGLVVTGYVDESREPGTELPGGKVLGVISSLPAIVAATKPNRIIVGMFERRNRMPMNDLLELRFAGHIIEEAANVYERVCGRVCLTEIRPSQLIYSGELGPRGNILFYQYLMNSLLAGIGLVLASPLMLLTALAVKLTSAGPVLYRQVRVGLNGAPFTLYKFRSMRADAEVDTGAVWASKDDPRVTPVGKIIRQIRFDELPQIVNVLKGEMSIVGPRPERPEFVKTLTERIPYYRQRHCIRPGITGWAQINFKYGDTLQDTVTKLEYDLYYIKNMTTGLDLYIIFHTVKAMLLSRGAQ
jgi:sugar transferase (PEP-CTERM system associated)